MSLVTPNTIRTLQRKLYAKAKQEPAFRFYALYDKCQAPCDYIPRRSYPLFLARDVLRLLREEARCAQQAARTTSQRSTRRPASDESELT
jgi:hypothetical protein